MNETLTRESLSGKEGPGPFDEFGCGCGCDARRGVGNCRDGIVATKPKIDSR